MTVNAYPSLPDDRELGEEIRSRIINLTPHVVRLLRRRPEGGFALLADLDPAPTPARVVMTPGTPLETLPWVEGFPFRACSVPSEVTGLPAPYPCQVTAPPQRQPLYVVSALVALSLQGQGRADVFTVGTGPDDLERKDGQVWGTYVLEQAPQ